MMIRNPFSSFACALALMTASATMPLHAREWSDPTGHYQVEAEFVTADQKRAVLRNADGKLLVIPRAQLSEADQEFVQQAMRGARQDAVADAPDAPRGQASALEAATGEQSAESAPRDQPRQSASSPQRDLASVRAMAPDDQWRLVDGDTIEGELVGFGQQTLTILREDADVLVNGVAYPELPSALKKIVPNVVSAVDQVSVTDRETLEDYLVAQGAGPAQYSYNGIRVRLDEQTVVTIPLSLLPPEEAEGIRPGLQRWLAAQREEVSAKDRQATDRTERLLLDSRRRSYRNYRAAGQPVPSPGASPIQVMDLQLEAASAGVTDIWEVLLYPNVPYRYPRTVVVSAENSRGAKLVASSRYPGWRPGPVRKLSI